MLERSITIRESLGFGGAPAARTLIIAEVAQSHDGSLGTAHAYIEAAAAAGADAVKFQTHLAAEESTPAEPWRVRFSPQDETRYDYWRRMEFSAGQWAGLKKHAEGLGLLFLSSPFSLAAVELLAGLGMKAWKIPSGEVGNDRMLEAILAFRKPVFLSTGMSDYLEIERAVRRVKDSGVPLVVMQCTSEYPCPPEKVGINLVGEFRRRFGCGTGLSDHSGTIYPSLAAAFEGADAVEVHITLSRESFGPDVQASVTTSELRMLVDGVRFIERMRSSPVDKDQMAVDRAGMRALFTKSIVARRALRAGDILTEADIAFKKPGTGIPERDVARVLHRRLVVDLPADALIMEEHLD